MAKYIITFILVLFADLLIKFAGYNDLVFLVGCIWGAAMMVVYLYLDKRYG